MYWEEFGTLKEGSMFDERCITIKRKPTGPEMTQIEKAIEQKLKDLGILGRPDAT